MDCLRFKVAFVVLGMPDRPVDNVPLFKDILVHLQTFFLLHWPFLAFYSSLWGWGLGSRWEYFCFSVFMNFWLEPHCSLHGQVPQGFWRFASGVQSLSCQKNCVTAVCYRGRKLGTAQNVPADGMGISMYIIFLLLVHRLWPLYNWVGSLTVLILELSKTKGS